MQLFKDIIESASVRTILVTLALMLLCQFVFYRLFILPINVVLSETPKVAVMNIGDLYSKIPVGTSKERIQQVRVHLNNVIRSLAEQGYVVISADNLMSYSPESVIPTDIIIENSGVLLSTGTSTSPNNKDYSHAD